MVEKNISIFIFISSLNSSSGFFFKDSNLDSMYVDVSVGKQNFFFFQFFDSRLFLKCFFFLFFFTLTEVPFEKKGK